MRSEQRRKDNGGTCKETNSANVNRVSSCSPLIFSIAIAFATVLENAIATPTPTAMPISFSRSSLVAVSKRSSLTSFVGVRRP